MNQSQLLAGADVVITRSSDDVVELQRMVQAQGGRTRCVPMLRFVEPANVCPLAAARREIGHYDVIVLTSRYAAWALLDSLPCPHNKRPLLVALGTSTAKVIRELQWPVDVDGGGAGADALAQQMAQNLAIEGTLILYPRSSLARSTLPQKLRDAGAEVIEVEAYQTLPPERSTRQLMQQTLQRADLIFVYASPSAVKHLDFILQLKQTQSVYTWENMCAVSIGPSTSKALRDVGTRRIFEAKQPNDAALLDAIVEAWQASIATQTPH